MSDPAVATPVVAPLVSRSVIAVAGPDWRSFLQGLVTQDVETLADGEARFAGLLTPQGRLLFDLFIVGRAGDGLIDCVAEHRGALMQRLQTYRLRAKVEIAAETMTVHARWGDLASADAEEKKEGWVRDPRLPGLGFRGYGAPTTTGTGSTDEAAYDAHRSALGVPGPVDWGTDKTYPIEANFDLLGGIDFKKGCFVGQETTSRMKRRGTIKSRMAPITFAGPPPAFGTELLAGDLRAGQVLSGRDGRAMAMLRLDRLDTGPFTWADGRAWRADLPAWIQPIRPD